MTDWLLEEIATARRTRTPCALITVAETKGSVPRAAGSKMLVYGDGTISGTVGGGKFEALVIDQAREQIRAKQPLLKTYPLHESSAQSFGAICGGEVTVFIEPQILNEAIFLVGGGHCAQAIAKLAVDCGLAVTVIEDRTEQAAAFPAEVVSISDSNAPSYIESRPWQADEALVLVSRNYELDREALGAAIATGGMGYLGMIGSRRKVQRVYDELKSRGVPAEKLNDIYAPLGLDIGADSPAEIAASVVAEILAVLRKRSAKHLKI